MADYGTHKAPRAVPYPSAPLAQNGWTGNIGAPWGVHKVPQIGLTGSGGSGGGAVTPATPAKTHGRFYPPVR